MPSPRRIKSFGLAIVLFILITIYWTTAEESTRSSEFYKSTTAALQEKQANAVAAVEAAAAAKVKELHDAAEAKAGQSLASRLKEAEEQSKKVAGNKNPTSQQQVLADGSEEDEVSGEKTVAGRVKYNDAKASGTPKGVARVGGNTENMEKTSHSDATEEEREIELELNTILKKSPIIIFSKSYCPYSKRAKHILLDLYKITPAPYVVELDTHRIGPELQALLGKMTMRKTVPNILINGLSVGGGDDIAALHENGKIESTIKAAGGKRIKEVKPIDADGSAKEALRR